jgi:hypothetical protein
VKEREGERKERPEQADVGCREEVEFTRASELVGTGRGGRMKMGCMSLWAMDGYEQAGVCGRYLDTCLDNMGRPAEQGSLSGQRR